MSHEGSVACLQVAKYEHACSRPEAVRIVIPRRMVRGKARNAVRCEEPIRGLEVATYSQSSACDVRDRQMNCHRSPERVRILFRMRAQVGT